MRIPGFWLSVWIPLTLGDASIAQELEDLEGLAGSGGNDSILSAQDLGTLTLQPRAVFGWVSSGNPQDVDFYRFEVLEGGFPAYLDIDFADDAASTNDDDLGLDAALSVFAADGRIVAFNDDNDFFELGFPNAGTDPGSDPFGDHDPFIGPLALAPGIYYAAVSWVGNLPSAELQNISIFPIPNTPTCLNPNECSGFLISGPSPDDSFQMDSVCLRPGDPAFECTGPYLLELRTQSAPEPAGASSMVGLILLAAMYWRRKSSWADRPSRSRAESRTRL